MYLLDTNILSEILRPRPDAGVIETLLEKPAHVRFASELTRFELRRGASLRENPEPLWQAIAEQLLPAVQWLPVTEPVSLRAGELSAALRKKGIEIGMVDTLLAATAQAHGLTMVTRNQRHFAPIPKLTVENWFIRSELIALAERPDNRSLMASVRARKHQTRSTLSAERILELRDLDRK